MRSAQASELEGLADIWHLGWQDAHSEDLPAEPARHRARESFRSRLEEVLPRVRVADSLPGSNVGPVGFCITKDDEVHQLLVLCEGRDSGVAAALLADADRVLGGRLLAESGYGSMVLSADNRL